jgi:hypothetical protein
MASRMCEQLCTHNLCNFRDSNMKHKRLSQTRDSLIWDSNQCLHSYYSCETSGDGKRSAKNGPLLVLLRFLRRVRENAENLHGVKSAWKIRDTNIRTVCLPFSFVSVTMATMRVLSLLQILLTAVLCRAISLDPDLLTETFPSAAALTETQGSALNTSKVTLSVTYHRNQTGHVVAQVKFYLLRSANSHE